MPAIPEFLLQRLYVSGSLQAQPEGGFCFDLLNTLATATVTDFQLAADGQPVAPAHVLIGLPEAAPRPAAAITAAAPFALTVGVKVTVQVQRAGPLPARLTLAVTTREAGRLKFTVAAGPRPGPKPRARPPSALRRAWHAARASLDPLRPRYHFAPPANWMNDPNGLCQWQGQYHLFYQYNPAEPVWGNIHWGHATSPDLVHWQHQPVALAPTPGGPDEGGCFSGCLVDDGGKPTLLYTGVYPESQCLATGSPNLQQWTKNPANPVIAGPPAGLALEGFRDPCVWQTPTGWNMVLGAGLRGTGGAVLLYQSADLRHWDYRGPALTGNLADGTGTMWECPQLFALGDRWVLLVSMIGEARNRVMYFTGTFREGHFEPEARHTLDWGGPCFYAPQTFSDAQGRRLMFGWLTEARPEADQRRAGWSGVMSLPRVLTLRPDGRLGIAPAPELTALRGAHFHREAWTLGALQFLPPAAPHGGQLELWAELLLNGANEAGLALGTDQAQTRIAYDAGRQRLRVDTPGAQAAGPGQVYECPLALAPGEALNLRVFWDRSVLEVYANGWATVTVRVYPAQPAQQRVAAYATGPGAVLRRLDVWQIQTP
jgi:beta-fructofuranosidase